MATVTGQTVSGPGNVNLAANNTTVPFTQGRQGEQVISDMHSVYYNQAISGRVFHSTTTPLGLAIPIYTSVTPLGNVLWNPSGSGVNAVLLAYNAAYASGTAALASFGLMGLTNMGSQIGTAAPFSAFAVTTPTNGLFGAGSTSAVKSSNAGTCTLTAASTAANFIMTIGGINLEAATGTAHGTIVSDFDFKGRFIIPPGCAVYVAATVASVALYTQTLSWYEAPLIL